MNTVIFCTFEIEIQARAGVSSKYFKTLIAVGLPSESYEGFLFDK